MGASEDNDEKGGDSQIEYDIEFVEDGELSAIEFDEILDILLQYAIEHERNQIKTLRSKS